MSAVQQIRPVSSEVKQIPLNLIDESLALLRTSYDEDSLRELGDSMESDGNLHLIVVSQTADERYELIIGSRRVRAAKLKGYKEISAIVIESRSPLDCLVLALVENLHREDLNPFEEAQAFLRLSKDYDLDMGEIAKKINKNVYFIRTRLQLLSLPEEVKGLVSSKALSLAHAAALSRLPDGESQVQYARQAVEHRLTVPELLSSIQRDAENSESKRRVRNRELTPKKVGAKVDVFAQWVKQVPSGMNVANLNSQEAIIITDALTRLEKEVQVLRTRIMLQRKGSSSSGFTMPSDLKPLNEREEWSLRDINRINSPNRPSDDELARELGRSSAAIRAMRSQTKNR